MARNGFCLFLIVAYLAVQLYGVFNVRLKTQTAVISTVYETVQAKALAVRNEKVVSAGENAVTAATVGDCEKVNKGGEIAKIFANAESAQEYSTYKSLEEQLEYYDDMENQAVGQAADVESLNKDVITDINGLVRANAAGNVQSAADYCSELNDKFTRIQILVGDNIDFSSVMKEIEEKINAINENACKPRAMCRRMNPGFFQATPMVWKPRLIIRRFPPASKLKPLSSGSTKRRMPKHRSRSASLSQALNGIFAQ